VKSYFSKKIFYIATILTLVFSIVFVSLNSSDGPNPKGLLIGQMLKTDITNSFAVLGVSSQNAKEKLSSAGLVLGEAKSIEEIAKSNKKSPFEIVSILSK